MINLHDIKQANILVVDDQEANVKLLEHILRGSGYSSVSSTRDSREVPELYRQNRYDLVLLDLNMPHMNGFEVMAALQAIESDGYLPILVITAEPAHKLKALTAGARDFISKPLDNLEVVTRVQNMLEVRLLHKQLRGYNEMLEQRVRDRTEELRESYRETVYAMTAAAEHRDEDTGMHIQRIGFYCRALAGIIGMDKKFCEEIFYAGPMHDIGKIAIPDNILLKQGAFLPEEWEIMKSHTLHGAKILAERKSPYLRMGEEIALSHHEAWDGSGYPNGLYGDLIPIAARIMNICDIYDALRSKRPYKTPMGHEQAMRIIVTGDKRTRPEHFDPAIMEAFVKNENVFRDIYLANQD